MTSSFLRATLRSLYREKLYAVINILGLSIVITSCLILGLYLHNELTYDLHNKKYKKIYRVEQELIINSKGNASAFTSSSLGEMLTREYIEVEDYIWFLVMGGESLIRYEDNSIYWKNVTYVRDNVFDIFDHNIIFGDTQTAKAGTVAVSETFARKYFGNENPVGKIIYSEGFPSKISLVFEDLPENSHIKYDVLFLNNSKTMRYPDDANALNQLLWRPSQYTYLLMPEDYDIRKFKDISDSFFAHHMVDLIKGLKNKYSWRSWIMPLADIHYHSNVGEDQPTGNMSYIYGYVAVAIFLLLVATINYINLATARAKRRAQEVGMRKILGSGRKSLIFQFLSEAIILSLIAMIIGVLMVEVVLNLTSLNELMDASLSLDLIKEPWLLGALFIFSLIFGLLSGVYPAFYLSSKAPLSALMNKYEGGKGNIRLRGMLVLIQFTISVFVIACTFIMVSQMRYISNKALGFEKENRLFITLRGSDIAKKTPTIKKELLKNDNILGVSLSSTMISNDIGWMSAGIGNEDNVIEAIIVNFKETDNDFFDVMGLELVTGKDIPNELLRGEEPSYFVNESMVKKRGWENPLGKKILINKGGKPSEIIGVVKDFHYRSLHTPIEPIVLKILHSEKFNNMTNYLTLKISGDDTIGTLEFLEEKFKEFDPKHPFDFQFIDDSLNILYSSEHRLLKLIVFFAGVCIFVSCLGVFGLTSFTTEERKKEIAIRKVLGASTWQIIAMLVKNILLLVLAGSVISSFIAYYVMDEWMTEFAYRIQIEPWIFVVSAIIAATIAFITVTLQTYKTAQANPEKALHYE